MDWTKRRERGVHDLLHLLPVRHVCLDHNDLDAKRPESVGCAGKVCRSPRTESNVRPFSRKPFGNPATNALAGTGHKHHLVTKTEVHGPSCSQLAIAPSRHAA